MLQDLCGTAEACIRASCEAQCVSSSFGNHPDGAQTLGRFVVLVNKEENERKGEKTIPQSCVFE